MKGEKWRINIRDPENVVRNGHAYGGPLKLYHRNGRFIIVKWPSYTQWSGVGHRESNKVEYYLMEITEKDPPGARIDGKPAQPWVGWVMATQLREIEPGRKRNIVKELKAECDALAEAAA